MAARPTAAAQAVAQARVARAPERPAAARMVRVPLELVVLRVRAARPEQVVPVLVVLAALVVGPAARAAAEAAVANI